MYNKFSVVQLYPPTLVLWYSVTEAEHCASKWYK